MMPANELAAVIVKALDAKKGENIQLLKTQDLTTLADYFPDGDGIVYIMRREDCRWLGYAKHLNQGDDNETKSLRDAAPSSLPNPRTETPNA